YTVIMMDPLKVAAIYDANSRNELPEEFEVKEQFQDLGFDKEEHQFEKDLTGVIELPDDKPRKRRYRHKKRGDGPQKGRKGGQSRNRKPGSRRNRGPKPQ